jgi:glyoxylase-like metal-dependent hydrolase (beta-lactamase superfamily II)
VSELSWWFAPHPAWEPGEDWDENVPVVCFETDDEVVLIDPFLPPDDGFEPRGKPVRVLLTQPAHYRGTGDFVGRWGASVWVPPRAVWRRRPDPSTVDELPRGVEALELDGEPQQVLFFVPEHATLVSGDVLTGTCGRLCVFVDEADRGPLLDSLDAVAGLPIEQVITPHGDAVRSGGAERLREAVAEARASAGAAGP